jgi:hypothetical protein
MYLCGWFCVIYQQTGLFYINLRSDNSVITNYVETVIIAFNWEVLEVEGVCTTNIITQNVPAYWRQKYPNGDFNRDPVANVTTFNRIESKW